MTTITVDLDRSLHYRHPDFRGVALSFSKYGTDWSDYEPELVCEETGCEHTDDSCWLVDEPEPQEDRAWAYVVMVGDDTEHLVQTHDLTVLPEEAFCLECGQIGCTHDGRVRPF